MCVKTTRIFSLIICAVLFTCMFFSGAVCAADASSGEAADASSSEGVSASQSADAPSGEGVYTSFDELAGKKFAVQQGTVFDKMIEEKIKDAKIQYYNTTPDLVAALKAGKVDALGCSEVFFKQYLAEDDALTLVGEPFSDIYIAYLFPKVEKSSKLAGEINEFIKKMQSEGKLDELQDKWIGGDESGKTIEDYSKLPGPNGTLRYVTEGEYPPYNYVRDGVDVGLEIELTGEFCKE